MKDVGIDFKILEEDEHLPVGYKMSSGHIIFTVNMNSTCKAIWVKDGHHTPNPTAPNYAGVVSRESIHILLTHTAVHIVSTKASNIRNAYLQAPTSNKNYIICGPEFGIENEGKRAVIVRALYGGKSSGSDFWHHLRSCMDHLSFESSRADPDVWMRRSTRGEGENPYYEYFILYVDDCLVISDRVEYVIRSEIGKYLRLKE